MLCGDPALGDFQSCVPAAPGLSASELQAVASVSAVLLIAALVLVAALYTLLTYYLTKE